MTNRKAAAHGYRCFQANKLLLSAVKALKKAVGEACRSFSSCETIHCVHECIETVCRPARRASDGRLAPTRFPTLMVAAVETPKGKLT